MIVRETFAAADGLLVEVSWDTLNLRDVTIADTRGSVWTKVGSS